MTCLVWNAQSSILASGDDKGRLALWKLDSACKPGLLMQFAAAAPGPITHILFGDSSGAAMILTVSTCSLPAPFLMHALSCRHTQQGHAAVYEFGNTLWLCVHIWAVIRTCAYIHHPNLHVHSLRNADNRNPAAAWCDCSKQ